MSQIVRAPVRTKRFAQPPFNPIMVWLLQSPLHRLVSGSHLLVRYRGRKTGIERTFPVGFATAGDDLVILVGRAEAKTWWRNFLAPWPITVVRQGRSIGATGVAVRGETDEGLRLARAYFDRYPRRAPALGLRIEYGGVPDPDAIRSASSALIFVRVRPSKEISR